MRLVDATAADHRGIRRMASTLRLGVMTSRKLFTRRLLRKHG